MHERASRMGAARISRHKKPHIQAKRARAENEWVAADACMKRSGFSSPAKIDTVSHYNR
jgi:hypothetical protein